MKIHYIVSFLARLGFWPYVLVITLAAIVLSELLILLQSYWLTGSFFDTNLLIIGFITPAVDGFILVLITAFLIRHLMTVQQELKTAERRLRQTNQRLREAQEIAHLGFWELDLQQNRLFWSDEVYRIFGLQPQEFEATYEAFLKYVHPDDRDALVATYRTSIDEQHPYSIIHRVTQKDGSVRYVEERCKHTYDTEGTPVKSTGTIYDITERIADQEKLQRLFDLQENIVIQSDGRRLKKANRPFLYFFGYPSLEAFSLKYRCICDRFAEDDRYFHTGKVPEGESWIEAIKLLPKKERIVSMADAKGRPHVFNVAVNVFEDDEYIISFSDISETILEQISLEKKVNHDHLTTAYSREFVEENIHRFIEKAEQNDRFLGLILFDIDHFKQVNDTFGHHIGDKVLIQLVATVKESIRRNDFLVRWGGEEFIIISETESLQTLQQMAEHVRQRVEHEPFGTARHITCSFGLALHSVGDSIYETIRQADTALYEAKEGGRNRVCTARD